MNAEATVDPGDIKIQVDIVIITRKPVVAENDHVTGIDGGVGQIGEQVVVLQTVTAITGTPAHVSTKGQLARPNKIVLYQTWNSRL